MFLYWVHSIKPYFLKIGALELRYYGLMYILAFTLFYFWFKYLIREKKLPINFVQLENLFTWSILGVLIGGRFGYVLFYNPAYYFSHPLSILKTWEGGMSFHGGVLGVVVSFYLWTRKNKVSFWDLIAEVGVIAPFGMFFGRMGNFLNGELWGHPSNVAWAIIFPSGGNIPRHPSQLYQALLEGITLGIIMMILHFKGVSSLKKFSVSIGGYAIARIIVEFYRVPDEHIGFLASDWLTMGQMLSFVMLGLGVGIFVYDVVKTGQKAQG